MDVRGRGYPSLQLLDDTAASSYEQTNVIGAHLHRFGDWFTDDGLSRQPLGAVGKVVVGERSV